MSEEIFKLYSFIKDKDCEMHYYEKPKVELITFIDRVYAIDFLTLLNDNFSNLLDEGGLKVNIVDEGSIALDLTELISPYCDWEEEEKWYSRFKKCSTEYC